MNTPSKFNSDGTEPTLPSVHGQEAARQKQIEQDNIKAQKGMMSFNPALINEPLPLRQTVSGARERPEREYPDFLNEAEMDRPEIDLLIGTVLADKYELVELLGRGGMGAVYRAKHMITQRDVAVKLMHAHLVSDAHLFRRFQQEATAAARIDHPNAIAIHDMGMGKDRQPYLIMDFLDGESLSTLIKREGNLPLNVCLHIFSQVCAALGEAHRHGVVHRDMKPSNVMILHRQNDDYFVKVVDFGIAKLFPQEGDPSIKETTTGELFGSPPYMSPEQCLGKKLDSRSDIYSMGCLMYEALTGEPPLVGSNALGTMYRQINETPRPLSGINEDIRLTQRLDEIILKSMQKNPDQRYQSILQLKSDIDSASDLANKNLAAFAQIRLRVSAFYRNVTNQLGSSKRLVVVLCGALLALAAVIMLWLTPMLATHDPLGTERGITWAPAPSESNLSAEQFRKTEHLLNAARNSSDAPRLSIERIEQARAIGDFYRKAHKYDEALMNYKMASDIAGEMNLGVGFAEQLIPVYAGAAECLVRQGRMQEATVAGSKAEYLIGAAKLDVRVESVKNLAVLCEAFDAVGNSDPAKADNTSFVQYIFHEAKIADRVTEMPMEVSKMADYLLKHDQSRIAVPLYQKALAAWKGQKENCDFNIAVCENQLGQAYMKEDAYVKAEIAFQTAVDKFTNLSGKDDLNRAKALFNLADAQWRRADFFQSFATHCEAKRIWALPHNS